MRNYLLLLLLVLGLNTSTTEAAVVPDNNSLPASTTISLPEQFASLSIIQIQSLVGRKLTIKEKIGLKVLQWKMKKQLRRTKPDEKSNTGRLALIFGITGIVSLLLIFAGIPSLFFLSGIMALLALIFGSKAKRENPNDKQAKSAIIIGWITLALLLALVVAALAAFGGGWGWG